MVSPCSDEISAALERAELFAQLSQAGRHRLAGALTVTTLGAGEALFRYGETGDSLFIVAAGRLEVLVESGQDGGRPLGHIERYQCVGEMALLATNARRTATVKALEDSRLLELSRQAFEQLLAAEPSLRRLIGEVLLRRLPGLHLATSRLFGDLDPPLLEELQSHFFWVSLNRGEVLFRQEDPAEAVYYVVNGRLQIAVEEHGDDVALDQVGGGQVVGEITMITHERHTVTATALRDSDLIGLSRQGFEQIMERNPRAAVFVVRAMLAELKGRESFREEVRFSPVRTVTVVPLDAGMAGFGRLLAKGLRAVGKTLYLDAAVLDRFHGPGTAQLDDDHPRSLYVRNWLSQQEEARNLVVYESDGEDTPWTRRCVRQADRVLLVASADASPAPRAVEALVGRLAAGVPAELILVHDSGDTLPAGTRAWLKPRQLNGHHHLRRGWPGDLERLARFLTGRSVGLVLGAGGARGFANIGVVRALRESGVPVDFVGGASMGGFLAALVAADFDDAEIVRFVRRVLVDKPRGFGYTLPVIAMMSVHNSEQRFQEIFGGRNIEDLWLNLYCVSVNITNPALKVHREGPVWRAVRASIAIPGLMPPLFEKGELFVDGALLNSVPVDIMYGLNPGPVIASDVGRATALAVDPALDNCPSPGRLLWERLRPGNDRTEVPRMGSILMRCMDVSSHVSKRRNRALADVYLTPPVERYRILDFDRMEDLIRTGYDYTMSALEQVDLDGVLNGVPGAGRRSDGDGDQG